MQAERNFQGGGSALGNSDSRDLCILQVLWMRIAGHGTLNDRHSSEQLGPVFQQKPQGCPADRDHDIGRTLPISRKKSRCRYCCASPGNRVTSRNSL